MEAALGYEQSRRASGSIKQTSGEEVRQVTYTQDDVDAIAARVMSGKYSSRSNTMPPKPDSKQGNNTCRNCPPPYKPHPPGRCPANGKTCVVCKGRNHFAESPTCPVRQPNTVKAIETSTDDPYTYPDGSPHNTTVGFVEVIAVGLLQDTGVENTISVNINGTTFELFVDSGCKKTLLPSTYYQTKVGELQPSRIRLRPYGTNQYLTVKGEIPATLTSTNGASHRSTVYVVEGHLAEPLLGDEDAKALGIQSINPGGNMPTHQTLTPSQPEDTAVAGITANLHASGIIVKTSMDSHKNISAEEQDRIETIIERHPDVVTRIWTQQDYSWTRRNQGMPQFSSTLTHPSPR